MHFKWNLNLFNIFSAYLILSLKAGFPYRCYMQLAKLEVVLGYEVAYFLRPWEMTGFSLCSVSVVIVVIVFPLLPTQPHHHHHPHTLKLEQTQHKITYFNFSWFSMR